MRDSSYQDQRHRACREDSETPVHDWKPAWQTCNCSRHLGSYSRCLTTIDFFPITRSRALAEFAPEPLREQGHNVKLIPAQFVKPFVKSNKSDFLDAEAIAEAVDRQNMRFVPIKTDDQLDLQALHRVRDRLITRRTSVINQLRAFLLERGLVFAKSPAKLRGRMPEILENAEEDLTPRMRNLLALLWNEWKDLELQIVEMNDEVEQIASSDAACTRLRQIPGIGPLVATAIVAAIGTGAASRKGRGSRPGWAR